MTRRLTWLLALAALIAVAVAPTGFAHAKRGYKLWRGTTTFTLDPAAASALQGVAIKPLRPAKGTETTGPFKFPVTSGRVLVDTSSGTPVVKAGSIKHVGGLRLTKDGKSVALRNPWVKLGAKGATLTVQVRGKRVTIATIEGASAPAFSGRHNRVVTVTGAKLALTKAAADALTTIFGLEAGKVTEGTVLGTADLTTKTFGWGPRATRAERTHEDRQAQEHRHSHER
jgi:hypothetical protein